MTDRDLMLLWTDGWFESDATLPENADTANFGWYNYDSSDTISSGAVGGVGYRGNEPMMFNKVNE